MVRMFQKNSNKTTSLLYSLKSQPMYLEFVWKKWTCLNLMLKIS